MMSFEKIQHQAGKILPRFQPGLASARRDIPACDGRDLHELMLLEKPYRSILAQFAVDVLFVAVAFVFVASAAIAIVGGAFILFFVRT